MSAALPSRRLVAAGTIRAGEQRTVVTPELVEAAPLPTEPRARRRAIAARKW
ncbi:hypothetical protein ACWENS_10595 [Streptomyces sp. NPDC004532]